MIIRSRAPLRISFGGGATDLSPYTEEYGGVALNVAINKYSWGSLQFNSSGKIRLHAQIYDEYKNKVYNSINDIEYSGELDLLKSVLLNMYKGKNGIDLFLKSDAPGRSGLGGSATAFVATIGLFNHTKLRNKLTPYETAELAFKLEREDLKVLGGRQDQYASVFGGINFLEFKGHDFVRVIPLRIKQDYIYELEKHTILIRGPPRKLTDQILERQSKNIKSGKMLESLHKTKQLAYDLKDALSTGDFNSFGEILDKAWEEKKKFTSGMSTPEIDRLFKVAKKHGAYGGKITGAGGGGHIIFYCKSNTEHKVQEALKKAGATPVDFSFDFKGLQTWEVNSYAELH